MRLPDDIAARDAGRAGARRAPTAPSFAPNVIRGDFTARLPGVRAASDAAAVQLPLYGRIAAGLPIEALRDNGNQVEVPMAMLGNGEHYALEVAGDSMVDAGILDGDTVIIRKSDTAENGADRGRAGGRQRGDAEAAARGAATRSRWSPPTRSTSRRSSPPTG